MTTKGFLDKFLISFIIVTVIAAVVMVIQYGEFSVQTAMGQFIRAGMYSFVPCALIGLIWEGVSPKDED